MNKPQLERGKSLKLLKLCKEWGIEFSIPSQSESNKYFKFTNIKTQKHIIYCISTLNFDIDTYGVLIDFLVEEKCLEEPNLFAEIQ